MAADRQVALGFLQSLNPTPEEQAYYAKLTDQQLSTIATNLAARAGEQAFPTSPSQAAMNLKQPRVMETAERRAPEVRTAGRNLRDQAESVARSLGAGALTASAPLMLPGMSGVAAASGVAPSLMALSGLVPAAEGLQAMILPNEAEGQTRLGGALQAGLGALGVKQAMRVPKGMPAARPFGPNQRSGLGRGESYWGYTPEPPQQPNWRPYREVLGREPNAAPSLAEAAGEGAAPAVNLPPEFAPDIPYQQFPEPSLQALRNVATPAEPSVEQLASSQKFGKGGRAGRKMPGRVERRNKGPRELRLPAAWEPFVVR